MGYPFLMGRLRRPNGRRANWTGPSRSPAVRGGSDFLRWLEGVYRRVRSALRALVPTFCPRSGPPGWQPRSGGYRTDRRTPPASSPPMRSERRRQGGYTISLSAMRDAIGVGRPAPFGLPSVWPRSPYSEQRGMSRCRRFRRCWMSRCCQVCPVRAEEPGVAAWTAGAAIAGIVPIYGNGVAAVAAVAVDRARHYPHCRLSACGCRAMHHCPSAGVVRRNATIGYKRQLSLGKQVINSI